MKDYIAIFALAALTAAGCASGTANSPMPSEHPQPFSSGPGPNPPWPPPSPDTMDNPPPPATGNTAPAMGDMTPYTPP